MLSHLLHTHNFYYSIDAISYIFIPHSMIIIMISVFLSSFINIASLSILNQIAYFYILFYTQ